MSAHILDGKAVANSLLEEIKHAVDTRLGAGRRVPGLAMILVGDNPASQVYVRNKERACEGCGIRSLMHRLPATVSTEELLELIDALNADPAVDGILVQLPLPPQIDSHIVTERIEPSKDADGFHPYNMGRLALGLPGLRPCTPRGIMTLLARAEIDPSGRDAVILVRSNIVGRPMALELVRADATVTVCHSRTRDLAAEVARAELLVAAIGRGEFVPGSWIRPGAVVIDVGMNRNREGRLVGDVDFAGASRRASWITPVPGGVGPMTVATLLQNTLDSAQHRDPLEIAPAQPI